MLQELYKNLRNNRTMFFILDGSSFQFNNSYWAKKIRSKYVYNTNCFIPKWNDDLALYFLEIKNKIDNIRIHKKNINDIKDIIEYRYNHFNTNEDKEKINKYNEYFEIKYILNAIINSMKKDIFDIKEEKDLTVSAHWTIKKSVVEKVKQIAKDKKMSDSKVVNTILEDFFKNK